MNIEENRPAFTVTFVEDNPAVGKTIQSIMTSEGFTQTTYVSAEQFFSSMVSDPPHIVFMSKVTLERAGSSLLTKTRHSLPESSIVIYSSLEDHLDVSRDLIEAADDYIVFEATSPALLLKAADQQALKSYRFYMDSSGEIESLSSWANELRGITSIGESLQHCVDELKAYCEPRRVLYFKFVSEHSSLVITHSSIDDQDLRGIGYKLYDHETNFTHDKLLFPDQLEGLGKVLQDAVSLEHFTAIPFICAGVVEGVFVIESEGDESLTDYPHMCIRVTSLHVAVLGLKSKYEQTNSYDDITRSLKKDEMIDALGREIVRAARIEMPMSFLLIKVEGLKEDGHKELEVNRILKYSAKILQKHSRSSDVVGRFGEHHFAVILPHTGKLGATIKAERLRRIFESADFTKVIPQADKVTVSIGVASYPTHANTRDVLLETVNEALMDVAEQGPNKVCLAKIEPGFVAEFEIDESRF